MKYVKNPIVIEAFRFGYEACPEWWKSAEQGGQVKVVLPEASAYIETLEGTMKAYVGDYIIKGIKGELYPCKADIFRETYSEVTRDKELCKNCMFFADFKFMRADWDKDLAYCCTVFSHGEKPSVYETTPLSCCECFRGKNKDESCN